MSSEHLSPEGALGGSAWLCCVVPDGGTSSSCPCLTESPPSSEPPSKARVFFLCFVGKYPPAGTRRLGPPDQKGLGCMVLGPERTVRWSICVFSSV